MASSASTTSPYTPKRSAQHTLRSVAHLSVEKLERKRAIDRESQRALRQKNKAKVTDLEREVRRLQDELKASARENARLQQETQGTRPGTDMIISTVTLPKLSTNQALKLLDATEFVRSRHFTPLSATSMRGSSGQIQEIFDGKEDDGDACATLARYRHDSLHKLPSSGNRGSAAASLPIQSPTHQVWHNGGHVTFDFDLSPAGCASSSPTI
jgi:hypothetical protein